MNALSNQSTLDTAEPVTAGALMPRDTAETIVRLRNAAFKQYETAHSALAIAAENVKKAHQAAGTEFRETRKSIAFRKHMEKLNARFDDLPAGSFFAVGTNVNTVILRVWKDGRRPSY